MVPDRYLSSRVSTVRLVAIAVVVVGTLPLAAATAPGLLPDPGVAQDSSQDTPARSALTVEPGSVAERARPGGSVTINVTLSNEGSEPVAPNVSLVELPQAPATIPREWVRVDAPVVVPPGGSATATVTVSVPEDATVARRAARIAFTGATETRAGRVRHLDGTTVSLSVQPPPRVFLRSNGRLRAEVRSGESTTLTAVVENDGDEAVPIDPLVVGTEAACNGPACPTPLPDEWVTVDAPAAIPPGETVRVNFTVAPPPDADAGRYDLTYTLGIDDPGRSDRDRFWQLVTLAVGVWQAPEEPITRTFQVRPGDDTVTVTLSATADGERPDFEVALVSPSGVRFDLEPASVSRRDGVDLVGDPRYGGGPRYEFTYRFEPGARGEWTLAVVPENVPDFGWEITTADERR